MNIPEFISEMQGKVAKLTDNISSGKTRAIEGSFKGLKQIDNQLNVQKYRLVFIGEPGRCKTSTICNFLSGAMSIKGQKGLETVKNCGIQKIT